MSQQQTDPTPTAPRGTTVVSDADGLTRATSLHRDEAERIVAAIDEREDADEPKAIVVLEDWACEDWSDYDVSDERVMVAGAVADYSADAFSLSRTFEVLGDTLFDMALDDVADASLNRVFQQVDETHTDFHDQRGERFVPKSAVDSLVVLEP